MLPDMSKMINASGGTLATKSAVSSAPGQVTITSIENITIRLKTIFFIWVFTSFRIPLERVFQVLGDL
jgi:hypothetical protein